MAHDTCRIELLWSILYALLFSLSFTFGLNLLLLQAARQQFCQHFHQRIFFSNCTFRCRVHCIVYLYLIGCTDVLSNDLVLVALSAVAVTRLHVNDESAF
jgi:hypothetical protein